MDKPLVSVIIPVYNSAACLDECIESLINQTYNKIEFIFVNDGSTDSSCEILKKAEKEDARIKIIVQENLGLSAARNAGMKEAVGDYIMFLDSDDWIEDQTCEIAVKKIREHDADVVFWSYVREYRGKSLKTSLLGEKEIIWNRDQIQDLFRKMVGLIGDELREPQKTDSLITAWGKLYKRSVLNGTTFVDTKIIGTEDALFNIQIFSKLKSAVYIPQYFSHYRKYNDDTLTHQYKTKLAEQWKELYQRIHSLLCDQKREEIYFMALNNRICLGLIGLGLNIVEDNTMKRKEKKEELRKLLNLPHYKKALSIFEVGRLPVYWKTFFICAKLRTGTCLYIILLVMNRLRSKV